MSTLCLPPPHKWPPCGTRVEHTGRKVWGRRPHRPRQAVQGVRGLGVHSALWVAVVWAPCLPHPCAPLALGLLTVCGQGSQSRALESSFPGPQADPALSCGQPAATLPDWPAVPSFGAVGGWGCPQVSPDPSYLPGPCSLFVMCGLHSGPVKWMSLPHFRDVDVKAHVWVPTPWPLLSQCLSQSARDVEHALSPPSAYPLTPPSLTALLGLQGGKVTPSGDTWG